IDRDQCAQELTAARRPAAVAPLDSPAPELDRARVRKAGPLRQLIRRSTDPAGDGVRLAAARLRLSQRQSRDEQHDPHVLTPEMVQTVKYTQTLNMPFAIPTGENDTL